MPDCFALLMPLFQRHDACFHAFLLRARRATQPALMRRCAYASADADMPDDLMFAASAF